MAPPYTSIMMAGAGAIGQKDSDPWSGVQYYYDGTARAVGGVNSSDNQAGTGGLTDYANRSVPVTAAFIGNGYQMGNPTPDNFSPSIGQNLGTISAASFTMFGWVKLKDNGDASFFGIRDVTSSGQYGMLMVYANSTPWMGWTTTTSSFNHTCNTGGAGGPNTSTWTFMAIRYDVSTGTDNMVLTVNGETNKKIASSSGNDYSGNAQIVVGTNGSGSYLWPPGRRGNGWVDQVGYFDRVLSDSEIEYHYNGGAGRAYLA